MSRSASVALAYVMREEGMSLEEALQRLRRTRPCVQPNQSFMEQLRNLQQDFTLQQHSTVSSTDIP